MVLIMRLFLNGDGEIRRGDMGAPHRTKGAVEDISCDQNGSSGPAGTKLSGRQLLVS